MNKEELIKKMKEIGFEECSEEETLSIDSEISNGCIFISGYFLEKDIYFKPVEKFPIIFEGENYNFIIYKDLFFKIERKDGLNRFNFTEKDIEANQKALDKLRELRQ
jgi:hypothetical protein